LRQDPSGESTNAMAATAFAMYIGLALLAAWVERIATVRPLELPV
jgi:hypothetical protein